MKPMLASPVDWDHLPSRVWTSPKIDGLRCIVSGGMAMSRTWKPIPNRHVQELVRGSAQLLEGLDGELVVGDPADREVYARSMSGLMSEGGEPDVRFVVFDNVLVPRSPYRDRYGLILARAEGNLRIPGWIELLTPDVCRDRAEIERYEGKYVDAGFEGAILRNPDLPYKFGRATPRGGELLKLKRYQDAEAVIISAVEQMHNANEAVTDVQGHAKRSSHQAGMIPAGVLGALYVMLLSNQEVKFSIGTGFTAAQRAALWEQRASLPGRIVKFRHLPHGALESTGVPRHPVFLGFRDPSDL